MKTVKPLLFAAAFCAVAVHADSATPDTITAEQLAPNVHALYGRGGNIAVIEGSKDVYIVDTQYADLHGAIAAKIGSVARNKPVRHVINTHWHGDHTNGNGAFKAKGATVIAHENAYAAMTRPQKNIRGETTPQAAAELLPQLTFNGQFRLRDTAETIVLEHIPNAHTNSDVIVHLPQANVIHMGDILFNGRFPYIDTNSGGSIDGMIRGAERGVALADGATKIIAGHGNSTDRQGLQNYLNMLTTVRNRVRALKKQGKTLAEIQATKPAAEWEASHSWEFINSERFVESIYRGV